MNEPRDGTIGRDVDSTSPPMTPAVAEVQAGVGQLVMEHGEYVPLELLLAMNFLDYENYRTWREGSCRTLDDILSGESDDMRELLGKAGAWAAELGLEPEAMEFHGWRENAGAVLAASSDPELDRMLRIRFRRDREDEQTDLFLDTAPARAVTRLVDALAGGDAGKAWEELANLDRIHPSNRQRNNARKLIGALELPAPTDPDDGCHRMEMVEREWVPASSNLLGGRARDFLVPLWRSIGRALESGAFDPGYPEHHASRAYREGLDWEGGRRSTLAVPESDRAPELLVRLAEACWRLRDRAGAVGTWFALCDTAPDVFGNLVDSPGFPDWTLKEAWRTALEREREPETAARWLPAWMLLEEPGLAGVLEPRLGNDPPSRAFEVARNLLRHPEPDGRGMELRDQLKAIHPGLLKRFLEGRE